MRRRDNLTTFVWPIVLKSRSLKLLEPSGPFQACNRIALPKGSNLPCGTLGPTFKEYRWSLSRGNAAETCSCHVAPKLRMISAVPPLPRDTLMACNFQDHGQLTPFTVQCLLWVRHYITAQWIITFIPLLPSSNVQISFSVVRQQM